MKGRMGFKNDIERQKSAVSGQPRKSGAFCCARIFLSLYYKCTMRGERDHATVEIAGGIKQPFDGRRIC